MGLLDKLFGRAPSTGNSDGLALDAAVSSLAALYDDPEVKSERGLSLTGPRANEVRALGRRLHKTGGKASMLAARDGLRESHTWAVANLEAIWASLPEWRN
ncbi:MAG: hypothetical protein M3069_28530 [Chloroflexota bacterium]|nr:hypothetical protein [Chloroflexota bacterium]